MKINWTLAVPWKTWLVALGLLAAASYLWNREHRLRADAQRGEEAARLALRGQTVEAQTTRGELQGKVKDLVAENDLLRQAYEEAVREAPDAKPEAAHRLDTGRLQVHPVPATASGPLATGAPESPPRPSGAPVGLIDSCSLRPTDLASVRADVLELRTSAGNTLVAGTAEVWREDPLPRVLVAAGRFRSSLSQSSELAASSPPGWGAYAGASYGVGGWGLGAGALLPPARVPLLGWRLESSAGVEAEPAGLRARGSVGVRW